MLRMITLAITFSLTGWLGGPLLAEQPIPLHVAVQKGLVDVQVQGRGSSTGDSVQVSVKRTMPQNVTVVVEPGTVIHSNSGDVQSMSLNSVRYEQVGRELRPVTKIELNDDKRKIYIVEGFCRDFEKPTPQSQNTFDVQQPDEADTKVLVQANKLGATVKVTQAALWIQRSKLTDEQLAGNFPIDEEELNAARQLLVAVENPDTSVDVGVLLDKLRTRIATNRDNEPQFKRGDTVTIISDDAQLTRVGKKVIGSLKEGAELEVVRPAGDRVFVVAEIEGKEQRGFVKVSDLKTTRSADHAEPGRLLDAARKVQLEVFDKINVNVESNR